MGNIGTPRLTQLPAIEHGTFASTSVLFVARAGDARAAFCGGAGAASSHRPLAGHVPAPRAIAQAARGRVREPSIRSSSRVKNPERSGRVGLVYAIAARVVPVEAALKRGGAISLPAHLIDGPGAEERNQVGRVRARRREVLHVEILVSRRRWRRGEVHAQERAEAETDRYRCRPSWIHHPLLQWPYKPTRSDTKNRSDRRSGGEGNRRLIVRVVRPLRPGFGTIRRRAEAQPH